MWLEAMDATGIGADLRRALAGSEVLARGPKAVSAARRAGLTVTWSAPDELFAQIVDHLYQTGGRDRVALQLDGTDEEELTAPLIGCCAEVVVVPVYRWAHPVDSGPAEALVNAVCNGGVDAVTFTTRQAAVHLVEVAGSMGREDEMVAALDGTRVVPVSVGPVCSAAMRSLGMTGLGRTGPCPSGGHDRCPGRRSSPTDHPLKVRGDPASGTGVVRGRRELGSSKVSWT
ncbi:MAG: hypothetical protein CM1200mP26_07820 [Acidimicrobiales bacterium]|nr:MAG: hypothetical protein CM1200mP26_07820 [Acidimicrobiales bacterium]